MLSTHRSPSPSPSPSPSMSPAVADFRCRSAGPGIVGVRAQLVLACARVGQRVRRPKPAVRTAQEQLRRIPVSTALLADVDAFIEDREVAAAAASSRLHRQAHCVIVPAASLAASRRKSPAAGATRPTRPEACRRAWTRDLAVCAAVSSPSVCSKSTRSPLECTGRPRRGHQGPSARGAASRPPSRYSTAARICAPFHHVQSSTPGGPGAPARRPSANRPTVARCEPYRSHKARNRIVMPNRRQGRRPSRLSLPTGDLPAPHNSNHLDLNVREARTERPGRRMATHLLQGRIPESASENASAVAGCASKLTSSAGS